MRILLVHKFLKLTGGADVFYREVGRVLRDNGHEVHFLSTGSEDEIPWTDGLTRDQVTLIDAPAYTNASTLEKVRNIPRIIWSNAAKDEARRVIEEFQPDLMHVFAVHVHLSPSVLAAAKEVNIPTVMTCNDYKHICPNYKLFHHNKICFDCKSGNYFNAVRNKCAKHNLPFSVASALEAYVHRRLDIYSKYVDHFTFSADFMARVTQEFWPDTKFSWSKLLNPFDSREFTASDASDDYGLYFGRLADEKGVDILIEAAAKVDSFPIKIVGSGPYEATLRQKADELNLGNVEFLGPLWEDELTPILSRARFVVVPSIWHENFPYVINQSFALGRPVIGANRGGIPELVTDGERGVVYDAHDVDALAAAMRKLAKDPELAREMGSAAKTWSDATFVDDVFYEALLYAYERARNAHLGIGR